MKKILYITIIICVLTITNCAPVHVELEKYQIGFTIRDVSFIGRTNDCWIDLKQNKAENINVEINIKDSTNTPVKINIPVHYTDYFPVANVSKDKIYYVLNNDGSWEDYSDLQVDSFFKSKDVTDTNIYKEDHSSIRLTNQYNYKLGLKYRRANTSALKIEIKGKNKDKIFWGYNYNVDYAVVHDGTSDLPKLNLVVMAEGYRADQMDDYKSYVEYAFRESKNIHYKENRTSSNPHIKNEFFDRYWNQIRVIRMDTISPQEGVDQKDGIDDVKSILNYCMEGKRKSGDFYRIRAVLNNTEPLGLTSNNIDAVIIFVNDKNVRSHSYSYGNELAYKYGQPVHPVLICAPKGYDPTLASFHDYVRVSAIAHELGHALARLQDEYVENGKNRSYKEYYRNVSNNNIYPKWNRFLEIDMDYGGGNSSNNKIGNFDGALYQLGFYRPTYNGTMNTDHTLIQGNYQFGPINTYHLVASFKIRTLDCDHSIPDLMCDDDPNHYEWEHYTIDDFHTEWPPFKFK